MVEKFFVSHSKAYSSDDLLDIKLSKKIDILFVDCNIENNDKFCIAYNSNNSIKDFLKFEDFAKFSAKIILFRIGKHVSNIKNIIPEQLSKNNELFQNSAIIFVEDCRFVMSTLSHIFSSCDDLLQIISNLMYCGINHDVYMVDSNAKIFTYNHYNSFAKDNYNLELAEKSINNSIQNFQKFILENFNNYLPKNYKIEEIKIENFSSNIQKLYLKNFFSSDFFINQSQLNNPDNFSLILNEIINFYKKNENPNFFILEAFIELCILPSNIEKCSSNDLSICLKKIHILSKLFDKISVIVQMSIVSGFLNCLNQIKSANISSFLIINLFENIIFSESKIFFIDEIKKSKYLTNRGIELSSIFSGSKVNYKSLFDEQSDYSFSEITASAYFNCLDKDVFLNIVLTLEKTFNPIALIFRKKFINFIIKNSSNYTIKYLVNFVDTNFDDIEKNRIRDEISVAIFTKKFIDNNFDKIRSLYRLIPIQVQQSLPSELAPTKNKSKVFN